MKYEEPNMRIIALKDDEVLLTTMQSTEFGTTPPGGDYEDF